MLLTSEFHDLKQTIIVIIFYQKNNNIVQKSTKQKQKQNKNKNKNNKTKQKKKIASCFDNDALSKINNNASDNG